MTTTKIPKVFIGRDGWLWINKKTIYHKDMMKIRTRLMNIQPFSNSKEYKPRAISIYRENRGYILLPRIYGLKTVLEEFNIKFDVNDNYLYDGVDAMSKVSLNTKYSLYDYQRDSLIKVMSDYKSGCYGGILKLATGAGKTFTSLEIARQIGKRCLIIVNVRTVANQWAGDIKKHYIGAKTVILSTYKTKDKGIVAMKDADFVICVNNSLMSRRNKKTNRMVHKYEFRDLEDIGFVIIDEIHSMISERVLSMFNVVSRRFILGITATPKKLNNLDFMIGYYIGPILFNYENSYRGALPKIYFINYKSDEPKIYNKLIKYKIGFNVGKINYTTTLMNLLKDPGRFTSVIKLIKKCQANPLIKRMIVTAKFKFILDEIYKQLCSENGDDLMLPPSNDVGLYYSGRKDMKNTIKNCKIILAITELSKESLNVKECNCIIMITSPIIHRDIDGVWNTLQMKQFIGRCLRQNWKQSPHVYIYNDMFSFFVKHQRLRKIYFTDIAMSDVHVLDQNTLKEIKMYKRDTTIVMGDGI